jgi:hypothetical protein
MKKRLIVTKTTRVLRVADILRDMHSNTSDEELLEKHSLSWSQLEKVYCKLFYGGYLGKDELMRRVELREGRNCSHIPLVDIHDADEVYLCEICGYISGLHFSLCPRCRQINLRRLSRRFLYGAAGAPQRGGVDRYTTH